VGERRRVRSDDPTQERIMKNQYTILVAEEEPNEQYSYREELERAGFRVLVVDSCSKILPTLHGIVVDALVTDLKTLMIGGVGIIQIVRMEYSKLPIIVITDHPDQLMDMLLDQEDDIQGLFLKPVSLELVKRTVLDVLGVKSGAVKAT
jgi:DNA-binding NtrC family response regulator